MMRMTTLTFLAAATLAFATLFAGCGQEKNQQTQSDAPAAALGEMAPPTGAAMLTVKGSDTEVNLVQRLAEEYMNANKGAQISVTGGGSGTGIAALINKQTTLANSSRPMKDSEIEQARAKGVEALGVIFAVDGLAVIVNAANPVEQLTVEQVAKIYTGAVTQWSEAGGGAGEISLYGRQSNSGTFVYFRDVVLKADYSSKMKSMNGTAQIVEGVRQDANGIGYVGVGYVAKGDEGVKGIKIVKLAKAAGETPASPLDTAAVNSGAYPLSRPLYQYINGKPSGDLLKFLQFEVSEAGQKVVAAEGYYPIAPAHAESNQALGIEP